MTFENGVEATLLMTAFSAERSRKISLFCTDGEIEGDMENNIITVLPFGKEPYTIDLNKLYTDIGAHGGGDERLVLDFIEELQSNTSARALTDISKSIESHRIAFKAEKSRIKKTVV